MFNNDIHNTYATAFVIPASNIFMASFYYLGVKSYKLMEKLSYSYNIKLIKERIN